MLGAVRGQIRASVGTSAGRHQNMLTKLVKSLFKLKNEEPD